MKKFSLKTVGLIVGLLLSAPAAWADVAVLIQISDQSVSLVRVEREDPASVVEDNAAEREATQQLMQGLSTNHSNPSEDGSKLLVRWYNAAGELIHHEVLRDPRFIHAPGSPEMELPEATQLLRAPNSAVLLRVKPREFGQFIDFNV